MAKLKVLKKDVYDVEKIINDYTFAIYAKVDEKKRDGVLLDSVELENIFNQKYEKVLVKKLKLFLAVSNLLIANTEVFGDRKEYICYHSDGNIYINSTQFFFEKIIKEISDLLESEIAISFEIEDEIINNFIFASYEKD